MRDVGEEGGRQFEKEEADGGKEELSNDGAELLVVHFLGWLLGLLGLLWLLGLLGLLLVVSLVCPK